MQLHLSSPNQGLRPLWWLLLVPLISAALKKETRGKDHIFNKILLFGLEFFPLTYWHKKAKQSSQESGKVTYENPNKVTEPHQG